MKHFLLITNSFKDEGLTLTKKLKLYIKEKGGSALIFVSNGEEANKAAPKESEIPEETECVLVLGGDGTLIRAASALVKSRLP